ncbi:DUF427 domain-containing protein [Actinokineospora sp. 24-640]
MTCSTNHLRTRRTGDESNNANVRISSRSPIRTVMILRRCPAQVAASPAVPIRLVHRARSNAVRTASTALRPWPADAVRRRPDRPRPLPGTADVTGDLSPSMPDSQLRHLVCACGTEQPRRPVPWCQGKTGERHGLYVVIMLALSLTPVPRVGEMEPGGRASMMRAVRNGEILAEAPRTVWVKGNHHFPPDSVRREFFTGSPSRSVCPWKGLTRHYAVTVAGEVNADAAWCYPHPSPPARRIKGHVAFWYGVRVEGEPVGLRDRLPAWLGGTK